MIPLMRWDGSGFCNVRVGFGLEKKETGGEIERDVLNVCIVKNSGATPQSMGLPRFGFLFYSVKAHRPWLPDRLLSQ